jgi:hypothetical protein
VEFLVASGGISAVAEYIGVEHRRDIVHHDIRFDGKAKNGVMPKRNTLTCTSERICFNFELSGVFLHILNNDEFGPSGRRCVDVYDQSKDQVKYEKFQQIRKYFVIKHLENKANIFSNYFYVIENQPARGREAGLRGRLCMDVRDDPRNRMSLFSLEVQNVD